MNAKIPLRKFAETLSDKSGISLTEAENFIKLVFGIAAEELRTGSAVRIKGLGAFSLSRNEDDPVNFEPDKNFAATVNSPFAIFGPVELADGVTDEMLSDIDNSTEKESVVTSEAENEAEADINEAPSAQESETEKVIVPILPETDTSKDADTENNTPAEKETDSEKIITEQTVPEPVINEQTAPEQVSETENEDRDGDEAAIEVEEIPAMSETETTPEYAATEWEYEEEEYVPQPAHHGNRFGAGFVAGLIVGLAIGALALCAYVMYYVNSTPENQSIDTELIETAPEPIA